jgi:hypothetical protein
MRSTLLSALILVGGTVTLAQAAATAPLPRGAVFNPPDGYHPHPPAARCCREKVWDKTGKEIGDLIAYDNSYGPQPLVGWVAYHLKTGDAVTLKVTPEAITSAQAAASGSTVLFTTPDCSGPTLFGVVYWPPLAKRYAMVLLTGPNAYTAGINAWLFVSGPLPSRVIPGAGTVFHSQWGDGGSCQPYPAPGYTLSSGPGGYWMTRVEDLYAKYKRPFYIDY